MWCYKSIFRDKFTYTIFMYPNYIFQIISLIKIDTIRLHASYDDFSKLCYECEHHWYIQNHFCYRLIRSFVITFILKAQ